MSISITKLFSLLLLTIFAFSSLTQAAQVETKLKSGVSFETGLFDIISSVYAQVTQDSTATVSE